ncbi:MAG: GAF domain-containing protein [Nannocystaceae bacterium]
MPTLRTIDDADIEVLVAQAGDPNAHLDRKLLGAALQELKTRRRLNAQQRQSQAALMRLARSQAVGEGNLEAALHEITATAAEVLSVARASVWRYTPDQTRVDCMSMYRADEKVNESGLFLSQTQYPTYFEALVSERVIAASDAHTDPATFEFSDAYLKPLGINSMLDAPIRVGGRMIGVICNEHVGPKREWTATEIQLATSLADFTALAMEAAERVRTERELRASIERAHVHLDTIESQRLAIANISAPIIDVWDGVVVLPIVGAVDAQRSMVLTERLLGRISVSGARSVIVDLTGVEMIDTMTANYLLKMLAGARLLGAFCLLSGISPAIAQMLVQIEVQFGEITTVRSLKDGLKICIDR